MLFRQVCFAAIVIAGFCSSPSTLAAHTPPNIVFLLVDDLGYGDFGCYGAEFYETPHIDALAKRSMRFTQAYSACTVCSPSRAAILTGRYPARLHLTDWIAGQNRPHTKLAIPDWTMKIDHQRITLPEALRESGYQTAFFGKWHLMPIGQHDMQQHKPSDHGFDINVGGREWGQPKGRGKYFSPFDMPNLDNGKEGDFLTDKLTDAAIDFLEKTDREQPFFLNFSYYTLHTPIMAPPKLVDKYRVKAENFQSEIEQFLDPRRAGMVEQLDVSVGRIIAKLEELGIADHTIVVLTGDNGGNYDETTAGLRDYKGFSHEGAVREPLIISWPTKIPAESTSDVPVIGTDFYPTLLSLAGLPTRDQEHLDGVDLTPLLRQQANHLDRQSLYWHYPHYHRTDPYGAVRNGNWKLIEFYEDNRLELFDLESDPFETHDLASEQQTMAQDLQQELIAWRTEVGAQMPTPNPDYIPKKTKKRK